MESPSRQSTISQALSPFFYANRLVGCSPFTKDLKRSRAATVHSVLVLLAILLGYASTCRDLYNLKFRFTTIDSGRMSIIFADQFVLLACTLAAASRIVFAMTSKRTVLAQLYEQIDQFDDDVEALSLNEGIAKSVCLQLLAVVTILGGFSAVDMLTISSAGISKTVLCVNCVQAANLMTFLNFVHLVFVIKKRYLTLNLMLVSELDTAGSMLVDVGETPARSRSSAASADRKISAGSFSRAKVAFLRKMFDQVHQISELINHHSGLSLLGITTSYLLEVISTTYFLTLAAIAYGKAEKTNQESKTLSLLTDFLWWLTKVISLSTISISCHLAIQEYNKSVTFVKQCTLSDELDVEVENELQRLFNQVKTDKLVFSACGMFEVDMPLLLSMIATVATYIVVLLSVK